MENKVSEKIIEVLAKELEKVEQELSFEKAINSLRSNKITELEAEVKRLNELLTPPVTKGEENE